MCLLTCSSRRQFLQKTTGGSSKALSKTFLQRAVSVDHDHGEALFKLATLYDNRHKYERSLRLYTRAFLLKQRAMWSSAKGEAAYLRVGVQAAREEAHSRGMRVLAIYCNEYGQTWWPNWGPNSMDTGGVGGSEEAVIFISAELVKLGYHVEVYGESLEKDWGRNAKTGVWWLPFEAYTRADIFVAWRYHLSIFVGDTSPQRYLWLQDISSLMKIQYTAKFAQSVHGFFVLSTSTLCTGSQIMLCRGHT